MDYKKYTGHSVFLILLFSTVGLMEIWRWRYHFTAVGKRSLMYMGSFGLACYLCDAIFLDRWDRAKAIQQMNAVVDQIHSKRVSGCKC